MILYFTNYDSLSHSPFKVVLGEWVNTGECKATGTNTTCGPGIQAQTRTCTDGTTARCTEADTKQNISCADAGTELPDCPKKLGKWINMGVCEATGNDSTCGPGLQTQTRNCTNGTTDLCTDGDTKQMIPCGDANTTLPDCPKQFGDWVNTGECEPTGIYSDCGPGLQIQTRTCTDGTTAMCNDSDTKQMISCVDSDTTLPDCNLG